MAQQYFAIFLDVMGVQAALATRAIVKESERALTQCLSLLESFHRDLAELLEWQLPLRSLSPGNPICKPSFVAEFSDCAFIVSKDFATVAILGINMMRSALRHEYPLRGGMGYGTFHHELSGVRTGNEGLVWSTSSFLGGATVSAYQAERAHAAGLRILIHPSVPQTDTQYFDTFAITHTADDVSTESCAELRLWRATEVGAAIECLRGFRAKQQVPVKAAKHYDSAIAAYKRFSTVNEDLPFIGAASWLLPA